MSAKSILEALRAVARECQAAAPSFSAEQAVQGLALADEIRAVFLPPTPASQAADALPTLLQLLPMELLSVLLSQLDTRDLARLAATCRSLWRDAPTPPPRPWGLVETELRRRAEARGLAIGSSLPEGAASWVPYLVASDLRDALRREALFAVCGEYSIFVDSEGRLLTCGRERRGELHLGHAVDPEADPAGPRYVGPPTLVPSVSGRRFVSVATCRFGYCLALSAEGEVYSWGNGRYGGLGHGDEGDREVPTRIESLSRIERIATGGNAMSTAIDENGRLYTWGCAFFAGDHFRTTALGYAVDPETENQLNPKRVDALAHDRVVGVALGCDYTLAVIDAGSVFSFGYSRGMLGHGSSKRELLPRQIQALAQTGRRFVAVAAGDRHALALTEAGEVYGWREWPLMEDPSERVPHRIVELVGEQVKLLYAAGMSSCAVTESGELYSWGYFSDNINHLGHGVGAVQRTPKRVERLSGVQVATVAMCPTHTLVADGDGVVWGFGRRCALGLNDEPSGPEVVVEEPVRIRALRVRARKSPPPVVRLSG